MTMDTPSDFNARTYFNVVKPYCINRRCVLLAGGDDKRTNWRRLKKNKKGF